jgi:hypothetical protein
VLTINNDEMRGICLRSGATELGFIGLIRPNIKPIEWDENTWTYSFVLSTTANTLRTCAAAVQPVISAGLSANYGVFTSGSIGLVNSLTGKSDIFSFGYLIANGSSNVPSYGGKFSDDLAVVQGAGRLQGDTFDNKWIYLGRNIAHRYAI